ncbi:Major Facilitator Superfamily (MFS) transporter [Teratosphaeria destructans]|uniref:Major Facilitator Superfamily (MFS) transporter n=1 Tax=Teratosphaeria destructans TaxID=418781 RepID=A0A9W7VZI9_9PEZI|nr:Major Facilitator Superfamily (MFS) transporter [Teratosphaeria destructans]
MGTGKEQLDPVDLEKRLDHIEEEYPKPSASNADMTNELNVAAVPLPFVKSENAFEVIDRGRANSPESHVSLDSHATLPEEGHDHQVAARHRSHSRAKSTRSSVKQDAVKLPMAERRGLLVRLCVMAEVDNPYAYTRRKKWTITFIIAVAGAAAPMGSSLVLPALGDIAVDFHVTATVVNLSVAFYMLAMSIFPLWWSSFSETLGRRNIYLVSFVLFALFNALAGVSMDIAMFIVMRCLAGGAAASVQAVGAGTVSDIWEVKERGRAMGIFYLGPLCGPLLSPIIGGALAQGLGWRSAQYFMAIFGACLCAIILFFLPETLRKRRSLAAEAEAETEHDLAINVATSGKSTRSPLTRTPTKQSVHVKSRKYWALFRRAFVDPLRIILYLQFPAVAISVYYSTVTFASLYILNISVQQTFAAGPYNYSALIVGLLYLPSSFGYFLASIFGGRWVDKIMHREARKAERYDPKSGKLLFRPEDRMKENAWLGAVLWPCALVWYGWSADYGVNTAAPMIANFFFGIGSMLIFAMATTMLTEFMPRKASNGVALNNFCRNIFSCVGVIVTSPLIDAIGNGWLFTGIAVIALVSGFATISAMKRYGNHWRIAMDKRMDRVMGDD